MKTILRVRESQNSKSKMTSPAASRRHEGHVGWLRVLAVSAFVVGMNLSIHAADVSSADVAGAYVWNVISGTTYASGAWGVSGNWVINGGSTALTPPGETDSLWFKGPGAYTVSMSEDRMIQSIFVGCPSSGDPQVTLNLGGKTLSVSGNIRGGWAQQYPYLFVTNGTLSVAGEIRIGYDSNINSPFGYFYVHGPDTVVTASSVCWGMKNNGQDAFKVSGGAHFSTTAANYGFDAKAGGTYANNYAVYRFTDPGTEVLLNGGLSMDGNVKVVIEKDADVACDGVYRPNSYVSAVGAFSANNHLYVQDGATLTANGFVVGYEESGVNRTFANVMTCSGSSTVVVNGRLTIGQSGPYGSSADNQLNILDGSSLTVSEMIFCGQNAGKNNTIRIENASLDVNGLCMSTGSNGPTGNWLVVAGTNSVVTLKPDQGSWATMKNYALRVTDQNGIRFELPADGYSNAPVRISGNIWYEATAHIEVLDMDGFAKSYPDTDVTLIETSYDATGALQFLAGALVVRTTKDKYAGTARVSSDGRRLIYRTPSRSGLMLIFR